MSRHHDPSKAVLVRPLARRPARPRRWWQHTVPAWAVVSLVPVGALALGALLATIGTP